MTRALGRTDRERHPRQPRERRAERRNPGRGRRHRREDVRARRRPVGRAPPLVRGRQRQPDRDRHDRRPSPRNPQPHLDGFRRRLRGRDRPLRGLARRRRDLDDGRARARRRPTRSRSTRRGRRRSLRRPRTVTDWAGNTLDRDDVDDPRRQLLARPEPAHADPAHRDRQPVLGLDEQRPLLQLDLRRHVLALERAARRLAPDLVRRRQRRRQQQQPVDAQRAGRRPGRRPPDRAGRLRADHGDLGPDAGGVDASRRPGQRDDLRAGDLLPVGDRVRARVVHDPARVGGREHLRHAARLPRRRVRVAGAGQQRHRRDRDHADGAVGHHAPRAAAGCSRSTGSGTPRPSPLRPE